jgi:putative holliday junction resolvase
MTAGGAVGPSAGGRPAAGVGDQPVIPFRGRVLGIDLGSRRVGVAVTDGDQRLATSLTTLHRSGDRPREHRALADLASEYEAVGVVFGLPRSLSGQLGPAAQGVLAEVEALGQVLAVPTDTVDERLTTVAAASALHASGRVARRQRSVIDQVAAAVLLQSWLDRRAGQRVAADTDGDGAAHVPRGAEMERPGT